ncbi:hypothetical protein E2542_SST12289 [Spatholobus suberectus]|nr:hypothetical protein E2542_SST12289 [Spatholobus suberectus]
METLVVVAQHRNQYYSRSKPRGHAAFGSSSPSETLGASIAGLSKRASSETPSLTPSNCRTTPSSAPVPINHKKQRGFSESVPDGSILLSELWAGPTYSNSPPPSSLPIPKFSVRPKRSVSLDLPGSCAEVEMQLHASSAPSSPPRERSPSARDLFDSATKNLCRILNLNLDDE